MRLRIFCFFHSFYLSIEKWNENQNMQKKIMSQIRKNWQRFRFDYERRGNIRLPFPHSFSQSFKPTITESVQKKILRRALKCTRYWIPFSDSMSFNRYAFFYLFFEKLFIFIRFESLHFTWRLNSFFLVLSFRL